MKYVTKFSFLFSVLLFIGCGGDNENESGNVNLNFKATYGSEPLVMFTEMVYNETEIRIAQSDFFISDIELVGTDNVVELEEINFVDFTNQNIDVESANNGINFSYSKVPADTYTELRFSIGVQPSMNAQKPADFNSDNPLSNSGYYWSAWDSFIFAKLQGNIETEATGDFDLGWFFHTGRDDFLRTITLPINITLDNEGNESVTISVDHQALFSIGNDTYFDIEENPANHDPTNIGPLNMIVDNYQKAITIE